MSNLYNSFYLTNNEKNQKYFNKENKDNINLTRKEINVTQFKHNGIQLNYDLFGINKNTIFENAYITGKTNYYY